MQTQKGAARNKILLYYDPATARSPAYESSPFG